MWLYDRGLGASSRFPLGTPCQRAESNTRHKTSMTTWVVCNPNHCPSKQCFLAAFADFSR
jgi:hypothetical protein